MKKVFLSLLLLSLLAFLPVLAENNHIFDDTGFFTQNQIKDLNKRAEALLETTGTDLIIITTDNSRGYSPERFAAEYYEEVRPYEEMDNYVAFAFLFDINKYGEASYGTAKELLAKESDEKLYNVLAPFLPEKDYYHAMIDYMLYLEDVLIPPTKAERFYKYLPYAVGVSLLIGGITVAVMASGMKRKRYQSNAQMYIVPNSLNLAKSSDIYLYKTETRTKIESSNSKGGGSFSSSSGRSYGGRSGSL
ncbi:MAG: TPM domain-containing protein [Eubacteriales bacterium]|nr:TPM domain-containing protein [Eubacteriales bacterium]